MLMRFYARIEIKEWVILCFKHIFNSTFRGQNGKNNSFTYMDL